MQASKILKIGSRLVRARAFSSVNDLDDKGRRRSWNSPKQVEPPLKLRPILRNPFLAPFLFLRIEVILSPEFGHESLPVDSELLGVLGSEDVESEGPALET